MIDEHRKDFMLKVADCDFVAAQLPLSTFCEDFSVFQNQTPSSLIYAWQWNFGVAGTGRYFESCYSSFTYPDTGVYTVKLVVNPGDLCSDSATMQLGVFPGFLPGFYTSVFV